MHTNENCSIMAVTTRWLSHGKALERVLDHYEALVATLDAIYLRKKEPAVRQFTTLSFKKLDMLVKNFCDCSKKEL